MRPETTTDRAEALRCGGAKSPTNGSISCGVTVVMATMKEMAVKAARLFVRQRPSLCRIDRSAFVRYPGILATSSTRNSSQSILNE